MALSAGNTPGLVDISCAGTVIRGYATGPHTTGSKLLCLRPQHIALTRRSAQSNRLTARLTDIHWQGELTHLTCDVQGNTLRLVVTRTDNIPRPGEPLTLWFEPEDAVLIEV